jgi:hypothetical protein
MGREKATGACATSVTAKILARLLRIGAKVAGSRHANQPGRDAPGGEGAIRVPLEGRLRGWCTRIGKKPLTLRYTIVHGPHSRCPTTMLCSRPLWAGPLYHIVGHHPADSDGPRRERATCRLISR